MLYKTETFNSYFSIDRKKELKLMKANNRESSNTTDKNREVGYLYSSSKKRNRDITLDTASHLPRIPKKKKKT